MNPDSTSETPRRKNFYQHAATFCLLSPFIGYAVLMCLLGYLATHFPQSRPAAIIHGVLGAAPLVVGCVGFIFGIIALFGIPRHGPAGILGKVLAGFVIIFLISMPIVNDHHAILVEMAWQPPAMLAQQIVEADRVMITREREDSISRTGDEAKKIIHAICGARRDAGNYTCVFDKHVEFYKGTNLLATIRWQGRLFLTDEGQFSDNSGVLEGLYQKWFMQ